MNILPKKSWHVRTKKNIERVRRDEEKAAEEEKERQRRVALAEQEARTEALRDRSKKRRHSQIEASTSNPSLTAEANSEPDRKVAKSSTDITLNQGGHINFFKDIEAGLCREGTNQEHQAERAAEKEKWEKNIGLLTYLGQSAVESQNDKPWYLQKSEPKKTSVYEQKEKKREDRDKKLKESMDPLREMKSHMDKWHKHRHHSKQKTGHHSKKLKTDSRSTPGSKPSTSTSTSSRPKGSKTVEEMRAERLRRELAERQKVAAVMARARGEQAPEDSQDHLSDADRDRSRGYNSRYNPEFVRPAPRHRR